MKVVLFDIDGTLISTAGAGRAAMEAALARYFGLSGPIGRVAMSGRTDRIIARDLFELHGIDEGPRTWPEFRDAYLGSLPGFLAQSNGRVLPGIESLLARLAGRADVKLGLLTGNIREGARLKLSHYGLHDYFVLEENGRGRGRALGGFGDDVHERDDVARAALDDVRARVEPNLSADDIWVIGDTTLDITCARAIGARVLAVATGDYGAEQLAASKPDILLSDLADPEPLLAVLE